jgi:hypothetical protein
MNAAFSIAPLGVGESVSGSVADAVRLTWRAAVNRRRFDAPRERCAAGGNTPAQLSR